MYYSSDDYANKLRESIGQRRKLLLAFPKQGLMHDDITRMLRRDEEALRELEATQAAEARVS